MQHHQKIVFTDGSKLVMIAPPAALDEHLDIIDNGGLDGGAGVNDRDGHGGGGYIRPLTSTTEPGVYDDSTVC